MLDVLDRLDEITHSGIVRKQRSITRLFPEFPARVKAIGDMGGIRLLEMKPDYWHFKLHSGTKENVWYDAYIRFKDLIEFLSDHVGDKRLWTKDKQHVNLMMLGKRVMFDCQIQIKCLCPAFQYWGPSYILSLRKYDGIFGDRENRPPRKRNPRQYGAICKHAQAMLNAYPFYLSTLAGFLRDQHTSQIRYLEKEAKKEGELFKKRGAALGQKKKTREEEPIEPETPEEGTSEVEVEGDEEERQPRDVRGRWARKPKRNDGAPRESRISEAMADRLGQCYNLAGRYVMDNQEAILVHGTINGRRWGVSDHDNPHAWVEEGDEVYDLVWDQRFPKDAYYGMMQAKVVKKYTYLEMAKLMLKNEHWGPWPDVKEAFEDIFKPISDEDLEKRIPNNAVILITDLWWDKAIGDLITYPRSSKNKLYVKKDTVMIPEPDNPNHPYLKGVYRALKSLYNGEEIAITLKPEWYKPYKKKNNEAFEDVFQPHSEEEVEKRIPKDAVVMVTDLWFDEEQGDLFVDEPDNGWLYLAKGTVMTPVEYEDEEGEFEGGGRTTSLKPEWYRPYHTNEAFADIFQPITQDELQKRKEKIWKSIGATKNPDGTWSYKSYTLNTKLKFPILTKSYSSDVEHAGNLNEIPPRAKASINVANELAKKGVKWIQFSQLKQIPPRGGDVNSGIQLVGEYKNLIIIYSNKVGVGIPSSGNLAWVGPKKDVARADGSTYVKSLDALKGILKKIEKFEKKDVI